MASASTSTYFESAFLQVLQRIIGDLDKACLTSSFSLQHKSALGWRVCGESPTKMVDKLGEREESLLGTWVARHLVQPRPIPSTCT